MFTSSLFVCICVHGHICVGRIDAVPSRGHKRARNDPPKRPTQTNKEMLENAATPECTTEAIRAALTAPYPKTRIVVATLGKAPAWVGKVLKWTMPDRVLDQMLMAAF